MTKPVLRIQILKFLASRIRIKKGLYRTELYLEWMLIEANGVENTASRPDIHTVRHREVGPRI